MKASVPEIRIRKANRNPVRPDAAHVLYWMTSARRTRFNFGLQRAVEHARHLGRPLVVLEAIRCDYPRASDRFHRFLIDGMEENGPEIEKAGGRYLSYVERRKRQGRGLLKRIAKDACVVVTDDAPVFFLPRMIEAAAGQVPISMEAVDSWGILPLHLPERVFSTAYAFRRFLQTNLRDVLKEGPVSSPLRGIRLPSFRGFPASLTRRWPSGHDVDLSSLPIDHAVRPAARGGGKAARRLLRNFIRSRLSSYHDLGNHPDEVATSGLSPHLHFGHLSSWEVFAAVRKAEGWTPGNLAKKNAGKRSGWWGMGPGAEAFLDQLITWRELGANMAAHRPGFDQYESLPYWARETLDQHRHDPRPHSYTPDEFERAETHDEIWNAAQRQLVQEGRIHNYLRMLWGKKILEWAESPERALETMVHLNDKYALDGRDPNSTSGIFWILGRYDRPWGPERPVFGKIRYMSSANTARKLHLKNYLKKYSGDPSP